MRKLKNWLLTAGIAAVMATGVAVGAHLTTNDAPLRTEAAANSSETISLIFNTKNGYSSKGNVGGTGFVVLSSHPNIKWYYDAAPAAVVSGKKPFTQSGTNGWQVGSNNAPISSTGWSFGTEISNFGLVNKGIADVSIEAAYGNNGKISCMTESQNVAKKTETHKFVFNTLLTDGNLNFKATNCTSITIKQIDLTIKPVETTQNNLATFKGMIDKDIAYTDENRKQDTTNCYAHYDAAKQYFTETLTKEERISFMEGTDYTNQVERFTHWAAVRGDSIVKDTTLGYKIVSGQKGLLTNDFFKDNTATIAIIVSVSVLAISGIAIFAITRHKKLAK